MPRKVPLSRSEPATPPPSSPPTDFEPLGTTALPRTPFFVVIPAVESFGADERAEYEAGRYSLRICEHIPEHEDFADFLIERSVAAWTRSQG
jgi:hypothetical protein